MGQRAQLRHRQSRQQLVRGAYFKASVTIVTAYAGQEGDRSEMSAIARSGGDMAYICNEPGISEWARLNSESRGSNVLDFSRRQ